jgi:hypothetical protein
MVIYKTKDLGEAAALLTKNIKFRGLDKDPLGFSWFMFEGKGIKTISDKFWFGKLLVCAKRYEENRALLTDRLHALKNNLS